MENNAQTLIIFRSNSLLNVAPIPTIQRITKASLRHRQRAAIGTAVAVVQRAA